MAQSGNFLTSTAAPLYETEDSNRVSWMILAETREMLFLIDSGRQSGIRNADLVPF